MELNSVYITSKNALRHIKKAFQRQSFSWGQRGKKSLKDEEETSVISLTTMSFETALAITNQKTIKDENKDKLKGLCFMVKMIENECECSVHVHVQYSCASVHLGGSLAFEMCAFVRVCV